jgi:hypothetical protein
VFYDHLYDKHNSGLRHLIGRLIELRQRMGINCRSQVRGSCLRWCPRYFCTIRPLDECPLSLPIQKSVIEFDRLIVHWNVQVKILKAERDVYAAEIDERLIMKIGPGDFSPAKDKGAAVGELSAQAGLLRAVAWPTQLPLLLPACFSSI